VSASIAFWKAVALSRQHGPERSNHLVLRNLAYSGSDDPMMPERVPHATGSVSVELVCDRKDLDRSRFERPRLGARHQRIKLL